MFFATNDQYIFIHTRFNKLVCHTYCIYKAAALIANIQCADFFHFHCTLHEYAATGEIVIRR